MARKKGGLGRGLAALIPDEQQDEQAQPSSPLDVIFGQGSDSAVGELRGGSARDLLMPGTPKRRSQKTAAQKKTGKAADDVENAKSQDEASVDLVPLADTTFGEIPVAAIMANRWQPREVFDDEMLEELADSIRQVGVLQPVVVRRVKDADVSRETSSDSGSDGGAGYELIMGERRWRAAQRAGLETIPALIRDTEDSDMLREALLENLHRSQLNPLEEAAAYQQLMDDFACTQAELSARVARSRSQIANTLRLLKLPGSVQRRVAAEVLSAGHARALLGLSDPADMEYLADRIVAEGLSVRSTEEIVALGDVRAAASSRAEKTQQRSGRTGAAIDPRYTPIVNRLTDRLETRIKVVSGKTRGRLVIEFSDDEDLARIEELIVGH
ncbi:ParB/RepB/Spo0J family partition protein [Nanchangia anserum]|uniref:ParB/RepB/Spo0J family partition protein n=1 Tax=Nanchangia anserum TaxID=2692125 RepID=A0A8I0GC95_9ACTO|nr:ParB/RepB/Spo0J family partition protein [Nanchangia anserum]MBD3689626.1 ParB/RepB/Spo0J family partition protein [Nanchangia anserum]QOX81808.1 ParB/RepB/Spo0J family partition protein [Nanchangia anserum]